MKLKILHLNDVAGIGSIISHYYNKLEDGNSAMFYHKKNNFSYTISRYYEGQSFTKFRKLLFKSIIECKRYDIIHIHGLEYLVPIFKILGKKVVLHYHGTDIRTTSRSLDKKRIFSRSLADLIIYNDKKILPKIITFRKVKKKFLPNPIDIELFKRETNKKKGSISYISINLDKAKTIKTVKNVMNTTIIETDRIQIPYSLMPKVLSNYEFYIDIRITMDGEQLEELSTTALQSLASGLKVFHKNKIISKIPDKHLPKNVIDLLNNYYQELFRS